MVNISTTESKIIREYCKKKSIKSEEDFEKPAKKSVLVHLTYVRLKQGILDVYFKQGSPPQYTLYWRNAGKVCESSIDFIKVIETIERLLGQYDIKDTIDA